ncbi:glycosyltransferase 87 family protein [Actinoplanes sp. NPDC000266]
MGRQRVVWVTAGLVAAVTAGAALARPAEVRLSDLSVYLGAVSGLADGDSLYDFIRGAAPFTYPPFAALLLAPLTWAPVALVQAAWTLATLGTVAGLARLVVADRRRGTAEILTLVLLLSAPVASDIKYGQVSLFLAALIAVDLLALRRTPWHGVLIGLAAAVKLTPLIFVPLLWFSGRRRAALMASATFAGCGALAVMALPGDSWRFWTAEVFQVDRLGYITGVGNQSLNGAFMRLGLDSKLAVLVLGGIVAALALHRGSRLARNGDWLSAMTVVGAGSVVLSPVSWTHHQIWLVLAALLPVTRARTAWAVLVLAVMLLPVTAVLSEARLLLAIAVAAAVPLTVLSRGTPAVAPAAVRR